MRIIFIRHGETETNVRGITPKMNDSVGLTPNGKLQCELLASVVKNYQIDYVYSSPEKRAQETTEILVARLAVPYKIIQEFHERDWGEWAGRPWDEILQFLNSLSLEERYTFIPPRGESWQQIEERLKRALAKITSGGHACVAVVTHTGALRALMSVLKNEPYGTSLGYEFENASMTIFEYRGDKYYAQVINSTEHLTRDKNELNGK